MTIEYVSTGENRRLDRRWLKLLMTFSTILFGYEKFWNKIEENDERKPCKKLH